MSEYVSKFTIAVPLPDQTANRISHAFIHHVILKYGISNEILTNQGTNFQSEQMKELCKQLDIKRLRTNAYHPQTDGAVERSNKTFAHMITAYAKERPKEWADYLAYALWAYNSSEHASTRETPFFIVFSRDPQEPGDLNPPARYCMMENENNIFSQRWHEALDQAFGNSKMAQQRQQTKILKEK